MLWNRSVTLALASNSCPVCAGGGLRQRRYKPGDHPCNCVLRGIFRICHQHFIRCQSSTGPASPRLAEYSADYCLIAQRVLNPEDYRLFRFHFLLGASWRLCAPHLGIDRWTFFHAVYRIEERLGRAFAETEPYPLFPLNQYFVPATPALTLAHAS